MKIIEYLAIILVIFLLLWILVQNADQTVYLEVFKGDYPDFQVSTLMLINLGIGAILGVLLLSVSFMKMKSEMRLLIKKNKQLMKELENLRNISVEEIPDEGIQDVSESKN